MTREEITAFFARRQEYWTRLDASSLAAGHAHDGVVESPMAGTLTGRAEIEANYRTWFAAFPDFKLQTEYLMVDGDRAALFWTGYGTHVGEFCGLSATRRKFQIRGVFVYEVKDNEITQEQRIYDFTGLLVQIGVLKAKPAF